MPQPPPDPVRSIRDALLLSVASLAAFPAGAVAMAILERGWLSIAALAAAMLAVSLFERRKVWQALGLETRTGAGAMLTGFAVRTGLLTGLFVVTLGILALFRDTALSRSLGWPDVIVIGVCAAVAFTANALRGRIVQAGEQQARGRPGTYSGGEVIEGEIIEADPPR